MAAVTQTKGVNCHGKSLFHDINLYINFYNELLECDRA